MHDLTCTACNAIYISTYEDSTLCPSCRLSAQADYDFRPPPRYRDAYRDTDTRTLDTIWNRESPDSHYDG